MFSDDYGGKRTPNGNNIAPNAIQVAAMQAMKLVTGRHFAGQGHSIQDGPEE